MPDSCNNEQQCCPPDSLGYKSCESANLYSASVTETFSCEGQPDVTLTGRGVSSVSQDDANTLAAADLALQLAIYRVTNPCEGGCTTVEISQITDCGDQNWPAGPASGLPYANTGNNVTGWTTINTGDFITDGTVIQQPGDTSVVSDRVNGILSDSFTLTGEVEVNWDGECVNNQSFSWFIIDSDNMRAVGFEWTPERSGAGRLRSLAWCDMEADYTSTSEIATQVSALGANSYIDFTFTYAAGVLALSLGDESISLDLGCAVFGYLGLGAFNECDVINLRNLNAT